MSSAVIAVMGMRSGSRRLPGKNIRSLCGRPLFSWALGAALESGVLDRVIVSTDDEGYASLARTFGGETPFLRPSHLSTELSPEIDYVRHLLDWLRREEGGVPRCVVRILATAPLQLPQDISSSVNMLLEHSDLDSVMVVAEARQHPLKAFKIVTAANGKQLLTPFVSDQKVSETEEATQQKERALFRSNVIVFRPENLANHGSLAGRTIGFIEIPQERAIDIDSETDFVYSELMLTSYLTSGKAASVTSP